VLDTSVLIAFEPFDGDSAISAASIAELHFGVFATRDDDERAKRLRRLAVIESAFDPIPLDVIIAREWGRLAAAVRDRGGQPRRRTMDLVIAATAVVHGVPLLTHDVADLAIVADIVDVRAA
jgi:predicted nucleic acid-binding protein